MTIQARTPAYVEREGPGTAALAIPGPSHQLFRQAGRYSYRNASAGKTCEAWRAGR
ncbi:MAG: hypothetical protein JWO59_1168 [Chloroflexi bacterium]|nr:hypothetical protein [Chloroflexota bacterium]